MRKVSCGVKINNLLLTFELLELEYDDPVVIGTYSEWFMVVDDAACWEGLDAVRELGHLLRSSLGPSAALTVISPGPGCQAATVTGSGSLLSSALMARGLVSGHPAVRLAISSAEALSKDAGSGDAALHASLSRQGHRRHRVIPLPLSKLSTPLSLKRTDLSV